MFVVLSSLSALYAEDEPPRDPSSLDNYDPVCMHDPAHCGATRGLIEIQQGGDRGLYIPPDRDK
jgi:hypothetical protein